MGGADGIHSDPKKTDCILKRCLHLTINLIHLNVFCADFKHVKNFLVGSSISIFRDKQDFPTVKKNAKDRYRKLLDTVLTYMQIANFCHRIFQFLSHFTGIFSVVSTQFQQPAQNLSTHVTCQFT